MKKFILFLLLNILGYCAGAQINGIAWVHAIYGAQNLVKLETDEDANIYAAFNTLGSNSWNPVTLKGYPALDDLYPGIETGIILKMNKEGKVLWHRYISQFWIEDFTLNKANEIIISGNGWSHTLYGIKPDPKSPVQKRGAYLLKINRQVEIEILYKAEHNYTDPRGYGLILPVTYLAGQVAVRSDNSIYWSNILKDKDDTEIANIALLDASGNLQKRFFQHQPINNNRTLFMQMAVDKADNLYISGSYLGALKADGKVELSIDPLTEDKYNSEDSYVIKFDNQQQLTWKIKVAGLSTQHIHTLNVLDTLLYVTGSFDNAGCYISSGAGDIKIIGERKRSWGGNNSFLLKLGTSNGNIEHVDYYQSHNSGKAEGLADFYIRAAEPLAGDRVLIAGHFIKDIAYDGQQLEYPIKTDDNMAPWGFYGLTRNGRIKALNPFSGNTTIPTHIKTCGDRIVMAGYYYPQPEAGITYKGNLKTFDKTDRTQHQLFLLCGGFDRTEGKTTDSVVATVSNPALKEKEEGGKSSKLYPNPSTGLITLELNRLAGETDIAVYSTSGQTLLRYQVPVPENLEQVKLDLSGLAAGAYFVQVINGGYRKTHKVIKN